MAFFRSASRLYGGEYLKTRKGRETGRPLATKESMHLVLRSSKARGQHSFRQPHHAKKVKEILTRFSTKYGVRLYSSANVGNHLHLHIQLTNRYTYPKFIRAVTAAIAIAIIGNNRWTKLQTKFWDLRPFTRVLDGFKALLTLRDYIRINQLEGGWHTRVMARLIVGSEKKCAFG